MTQDVLEWLKPIIAEATRASLSTTPQNILIKYYRRPKVKAIVKIAERNHEVMLDVMDDGSYTNFKTRRLA